MPKKKLIFLIFYLLFPIFLPKSISISSFEIFNAEKEAKYIYQFTEPSEGEVAYFFFKSTFTSVRAKIIDEENNEYEIPFYYLIYTPFKIPILKSQKYTFSFEGSFVGTQTITFIDASKELNSDLLTFVGLNFSTDEMESAPLPLIFNFDSIEGKSIVDFKNNQQSNYQLVDDEYPLYYCIKDEKGCSFTELKERLIFEKGKRYKIKLNYYKNKNTKKYLFRAYNISNIFQDAEIGVNDFIINENLVNYFYIINIKKYQNFYTYVNPSERFGNYFLTTFISEEERTFHDNVNQYQFASNDAGSFTKMSNVKDYLIIKIQYVKYDFSEFNGYIYIFNIIHDLSDDETFEIEKGNYAVIRKTEREYNKEFVIISSEKNMILFGDHQTKDLTNLIFINTHNKDCLIFVDSTEAKAQFNYYAYLKDSSFSNPNFKIYTESDLNYFFKINGTDSFFLRSRFHYVDLNYDLVYLFGLEEQYYLYTKKYFGMIDFYKYNRELNESTNISQFHTLNKPYIDLEPFTMINNDLLIVSGYQLFRFYNTYNSLYDLYFQKVNDLENITINDSNFPFNNLVKLLNENKMYYLDFNVDHLIRLDENFVEAEVTFIDSQGKTYILDNKNRKIYLSGEGIVATTSKLALLYFYKKMDKNTKLGTIEFDKSKTAKIMKFSITSKETINIKIAKDFGFYGYYPMLSTKNFEVIESLNKTATIYVENLYDKLESESQLSEGEEYLIYFFDAEENGLPVFNSDNYEFSEPTYLNNLLSPQNKYNFEILPKNPDGVILLHHFNQMVFYYQFLTCKSMEIEFKIENSLGYFQGKQTTYPHEETINENKNIAFISYLENEVLIHSFKSDNEFIFFYPQLYLYYDGFYNEVENDYSIYYVNALSNAKILITFMYPYPDYNTRYFVIIANKDDINNLKSFSDPCYVSKLISQNKKSIVVKSFYEKTPHNYILNKIVDISELNTNEYSELIMTIVVFNAFYKPVEFRIENRKAIEFKIGEHVNWDFKEKHFFKFEYDQESNLSKDLFFNTGYKLMNFFLIKDFEISNIEINYDNELFNITLSKPGTYYIYFLPPWTIGRNDAYSFTAFFTGETIDNIDLSQKVYYKNISIKLFESFPPYKYKVKNIKEDKYFYFDFYSYDDNFNELVNQNIFEICNDNTNKCSKNVSYYKFLKENEYTIFLNYIDLTGIPYYNYYYYPYYIFFHLSEDIVEEIEEGVYTILSPKIFIINLKTNLQHAYFENECKVYVAYSNSKVTEDNFKNLQFEICYSYILVKGNLQYKYAIVMIIPMMNDIPTKFYLGTEHFYFDYFKEEEIQIRAYKTGVFLYDSEIAFDELAFNMRNTKGNMIIEEKGGINGELEQEIDEDEEEENEDREEIKQRYLMNYNIMTIFNSPIKNMLFLSLDNTIEKSDIMAQNNFTMPIFVDKYEKDTKINIQFFAPRYSFFGIINNNLAKDYIYSFIQCKVPKNYKEINQLFPINIRLNTDYNEFYDFINLYFYKADNNINVYIKKIYGNTDIYECNSDSIDKNSLSFLTKPISICKNKKSILNKIYNFGGSKIITGYLGYNSYFDVYAEFNDDNTVIKIPDLTKDSFKNLAKYLKKDLEYTLNFSANHLVKLEPGFDAEVLIYDDKTSIKLNSENRTAELKGYNYKIKSNNNAMVYFYGRLLENYEQIKLEPNKGKIIEIKMNPNISYIIDFGFKGYNPMDLLSFNNLSFEKDGIIYVENIYEKLKTQLVENEFLYLYHKTTYGEEIIINYDNENLLNSNNNDYNFIVVPGGEINKALIINNRNKNKIKFQINFCSQPHDIKMLYQSAVASKEKEIIFNNEIKTLFKTIRKSPFKLRFDSKEDFVFSYSFVDIMDKYIDKVAYWKNKNEREELKKLTIEDISEKSPEDKGSNVITIKFNPNYKYSTTQYFIVIASKDKTNTLENLSNPCFITNIITEKNKGIKVINIADIGENDLIKVDVDISDLLDINNEFIVNIVSQELRYEKKINFYEPYEFSFNIKVNPIKIDFEKEQEFDLSEDKAYFNLPYEKESQNSEILLIHYKLEEKNPLTIQIYGPEDYAESININNLEGFANFLCEESGLYRIAFKNNEKSKLRSLSSNTKGTFKILSNEEPLSIDITKENIEFNELKFTGNEPPFLKLSIKPLEKDYTIKIAISNIEFKEIAGIVSVKKNNQDIKSLNFPYYTFEKNTDYNVIINFNQKDFNKFTLEAMTFKDFSLDNIQDFSYGEKTYNDIYDKFLIIDWSNYTTINIKDKSEKAKFYISVIEQNQINKLVYEFQNLNFTRIENTKIVKPNNNQYSVLMIELYEKTTIIFEEKNGDNNNQKDDKDDDGLSAGYIILIILLILVIIGVVVFFIIKKRNKNSQIDFQKVKDLNAEELMSDI